MSIMNTIRLSVTPDLKKELDFVRLVEYPSLTYAEMLKMAFVEKAARTRQKVRRVDELDYSDPTPEEVMRNTAYVWGLDEEDEEEEVFWDESKLKPINPKDFE